jgi:hypothetical protein
LVWNMIPFIIVFDYWLLKLQIHPQLSLSLTHADQKIMDNW